MFGKRIRIFSLLGFDVHIDLSWLLLGILILWSLAQGLFPAIYPNLSEWQYWVMALLGLGGLVFSIVLHEFCHSLVARHYGLPIRGITLFVFGGVAEMEDEPPNPRTEFLMAAAGPAASGLLAVLFYEFWRFAGAAGLPVTIAGVAIYMAYLNLLLAAFNLLPAFPLDGGRMLRAALWGLRGDLTRATRLSSRIGAGFGWMLVFLGAWQAGLGNLIGGIWWMLIGLFLRGAARGAYRQLILREQLRNLPVRQLMNSSPLSLPASATVADLMQRVAIGTRQRFYPVVEGARLLGCVSADAMRAVPRPEWEHHTISEYLDACPSDPQVTPDSGADRALATMTRHGYPLLVVTDANRLAGTITLADVLRLADQGSSSDQHWRA